MRSQCAFYVDAGYLLASMATRLTGTSLRSAIKVDFEELIAALTKRAEEIAELPLLRVNWYDASHNALPGPEQQRIGALPRVKIRLGRIGFQGEQKGVDLRIGLDMVAHARNGAVDMILLLSGDDDLTEAVEEAQMHGVQVVVLAVPDKLGRAHGVSPHLQRAADGIKLTMAKDLAAVQAVMVIPPPGNPAPPGISATPGTIAQATSSARVANASPKPAPPTGAVPISARTEATFAYRTEASAKPALAGEHSFTADQINSAIQDVVKGVVHALLSSTSPEERGDIIKARPSVPREVDRALLLDLAESLNDYDLSDRTRFQLRQEFWNAFDKVDVR
jgi:uncharacterized LabA/DUF88 family protein